MTTIASLTSSRRWQAPQNRPAPLTADQRAEKKEAQSQTQAAINNEVNDWFAATVTKANELGERFNKKPCYFLELFFQGGAHLVNARGTNAWNAFMSKKADEVNGG